MRLKNMLTLGEWHPLALVGMLVAWAFCAQAVATPVITSLQPGIGPVGTEVSILGSGFGTTQGSSTVTFSGAIATPRSWSDSEIVVPVPEGATSGPVIVTVGGVHSKGLKFVVTVEITNIVPPDACVGTVISIQGSGFGSTQGTSTVTFNGVPATPTAWSPTTIDVPVPTGATSGPLVVKVKGESASVPFTVSCD
jgi:hypothetical protein